MASQGVTEAGCAALQRLSYSCKCDNDLLERKRGDHFRFLAESQAAIAKANGIASVIKAMRAHAESESVAEKACAALSALATDNGL